MKRLLFLLPLMFGCFGVVKDDNTLSLTWSTGLVWSQKGPKDADAESKLGIDVDEQFKKPLIEHFLDTDGDGVDDQSGPEPGE